MPRERPGTWIDYLPRARKVPRSRNCRQNHFKELNAGGGTSVKLKLIENTSGTVKVSVEADGGLTEFEDNLVWRAAELLNISSRDRVQIRKTVREATDGVIED